ncbi:MAG: hypothetical protein WCI76_00860 [bacterium]
MTEKLKQIIKEEIEKLPTEGQTAVASIDWVKITKEIGEKFLLDENELTDFQVETLLVLTGITYPEFYPINIENQVGMTTEKAKNIAEESLKRIFAPIRNVLEGNIKKNLGNKTPNWKQSLNFIMSGGDYTALMETPSIKLDTVLPNYSITPVPNPPTPQNIKDKLLKDYK